MTFLDNFSVEPNVALLGRDVTKCTMTMFIVHFTKRARLFARGIERYEATHRIIGPILAGAEQGFSERVVVTHPRARISPLDTERT
ncbi:MAG: hypothetical protein ACI9W2_000594 [Gammaproteobacteria bacterium]|jgi:hypothetical protein